MKIALIVEGKTERAFLPFLRKFLSSRLTGRMPNIDPFPYNGRIPAGDNLRKIVRNLLAGPRAADLVIALTDVYTGSHPPDFANAADAKAKMQQWVGNEQRFHPHAAQYDFEAWLLPYWSTIQRLAGSNQACPSGNPENVDHGKPPSRRIEELFLTGSRGRRYVKARDVGRILRDNDLAMAVAQCSELKALVNTILQACGGQPIP
jgi:hypothetical protein